MTETSTSPTPRVVIVTGAASGIGYSTAEMFTAQGDTVVGLDITEGGAPAGVEYVRCDVSDRAQVEAAVATAAAHGRIDVLANVAGAVQFGRLETVTDEVWDRTLDVNLKGPFLTMQAALPHLKQSQGSVVNVASVSGRVPQPYVAAYSASKGGLLHMSRCLALELSPDNVRINVVCPGSVNTPMVAKVGAAMPSDLNRRISDRLMGLLPGGMIEPSEIASMVVYLASPAARSITGGVFAVDGGMS